MKYFALATDKDTKIGSIVTTEATSKKAFKEELRANGYRVSSKNVWSEEQYNERQAATDVEAYQYKKRIMSAKHSDMTWYELRDKLNELRARNGKQSKRFAGTSSQALIFMIDREAL